MFQPGLLKHFPPKSNRLSEITFSALIPASLILSFKTQFSVHFPQIIDASPGKSQNAHHFPLSFLWFWCPQSEFQFWDVFPPRGVPAILSDVIPFFFFLINSQLQMSKPDCLWLKKRYWKLRQRKNTEKGLRPVFSPSLRFEPRFCNQEHVPTRSIGSFSTPNGSWLDVQCEALEERLNISK